MLTDAQNTTLRAAINAAPELSSQPANSNGNFAILGALNAIAVPDFIIWRNDITAKELVSEVVGSEYVALTAVRQAGLTMILQPGSVDASSANIRSNFLAIFGASQTLTAITALAKRRATRAEQALATGTGSNAVPAVAGFVGELTYTDIERARA